MALTPSPLFLGLTRPARYAGLPVAYFAIWGGGSTITFILLDTAWVGLLALGLYIALRVLAEKEPTFFEVMAVVLGKTPPTPNRRIWGGDSYNA